MFHDFLNALAYLTRLGCPKELSAEGLASTVPWYPLVGVILGTLSSMPSILIPFSAQTPWFFAWCYTLLLLWLTRGLHWDGLADLCDALGSNARGERFWTILKDSHLGAFGAMGLVMGFSGQIILAAQCIQNKHFAILVLAPAFGRSASILVTRGKHVASSSILAAILHSGMQRRRALASALFFAALPVLFTSLSAFLLSLIPAAATLYFLRSIAQREGGYNGDFLGTAIISCELSLLAGQFLLSA